MERTTKKLIVVDDETCSTSSRIYTGVASTYKESSEMIRQRGEWEKDKQKRVGQREIGKREVEKSE
jgi:hypothetical protein